MKRNWLFAAAVLAASFAGSAVASSAAHYYFRSPAHHSSGSTHHSSASHPGHHAAGAHAHTSGSHTGGSHKASDVPRDAHGKIKRSAEAKDRFKKNHPCPATGKSTGPCRGYVIDHVRPFKRGGADDPSNMQWQTTAAAKAKDKVE